MELLSRSGLMRDAYLAGGTACALQIGHRISIDLDFFTQKEFDAEKLIRSLQKIGTFELDRKSWGTVLGSLNEVRFSIFVYAYPILKPFQKYGDIDLASLCDIGTMKIDAIGSRGIKRDFVDLYYICQRERISLFDLLQCYDLKYGKLASNSIHIQKSLVYFEDADASNEPKMMQQMDWNRVKNYFQKEVRSIAGI